MHSTSSNILDLFRVRETLKAQRIAGLRKTLDGLQSVPGQIHAHEAPEPSLAPGLPAAGIPCGVLNEVIAAHADRPVAFAFLFTLMTAALHRRTGPAIFAATQKALDFGKPFGHGLHRLGLDVSRLILIETTTDKDVFWAIEETLRSAVQPAIVAGIIEGGLGLTPSRRLNLAAAVHTTPLALIRGEKAAGTSAAATRWRLASAPAVYDRFGLFERPRWRVSLERDRNGRTGSWLIEWEAAAHRFNALQDIRHQNTVEDCPYRLLAVPA